MPNVIYLGIEQFFQLFAYPRYNTAPNDHHS
jgi:hypothetical protein